MRLTVGPLPAAVYWRRRAVVLVGLALVGLIVSYACGGLDSSTAGTGAPASGAPIVTGTTPQPKTTLLRPTTPTGAETPAPTAFTLSVGADVTCSDAEMSVTASAAAAEARLGGPIEVTITIKNISNRTCPRDIGADAQELRLVNGKAIVWSSDDCNPNRGRNISSFPPGRQVSYTLTWAGRRSRTGTGAVNCALGAPDPGTYQLVARLDQKLSEPFAVHIEA
jgi:hypothetical protein